MSYEAWGDDNPKDHDPRCVVFCDYADIEDGECPCGHGSHECSCVELAEDAAENAGDAYADWAFGVRE